MPNVPTLRRTGGPSGTGTSDEAPHHRSKCSRSSQSHSSTNITASRLERCGFSSVDTSPGQRPRRPFRCHGTGLPRPTFSPCHSARTSCSLKSSIDDQMVPRRPTSVSVPVEHHGVGGWERPMIAACRWPRVKQDLSWGAQALRLPRWIFLARMLNRCCVGRRQSYAGLATLERSGGR